MHQPFTFVQVLYFSQVTVWEKNRHLAEVITMSRLYCQPTACQLLSLLDLCCAGFAFVYFEDERDADDAIRGLDNAPFGYDKRRLSVEWARVCYFFAYIFFLRVCFFAYINE